MKPSINHDWSSCPETKDSGPTFDLLRGKGMEVFFMKPGHTGALYPDLTGCSCVPFSMSVHLNTVFDQNPNWHCVLTKPFTNVVTPKERKMLKRQQKAQGRGG